MTKVAIIGCSRIQDSLCVACAKCLKAAKVKDGAFAKYDDDVEIVALGDCGDCPGLMVPKMGLLKGVLDKLDQDIDVIHFGTCVNAAVNTAACPIDIEKMKKILTEKFGVEVVAGTHNY